MGPGCITKEKDDTMTRLCDYQGCDHHTLLGIYAGLVSCEAIATPSWTFMFRSLSSHDGLTTFSTKSSVTR
jgi:hypothetical protein